MTDSRMDPQVSPDPRTTPPGQGAGMRFEREDVEPGVVVRWAIGLGMVTIAFAAISVWLLVALRKHEASGDPERPALYFSDERRQPEGVRLQASPFTDLRELREEEGQLLDHYGWVDQPAGVVHIPVSEAMRLYLARQTAAGAAAVAPVAETRVPTDSAPVPDVSPAAAEPGARQ